MIAVSFALPNESQSFRRLLRGFDHSVVVLHTGVGETVARLAMEQFVSEHHPDLLISSGFAGGLDPQLKPGDLFLAANFSDPAICEQAMKILGPRAGSLATTDLVVETTAHRSELAARPAAAVDMETHAIASVCRDHRVPLLSLRVISDTAAAPLPAPASVLFDIERQRVEISALARHVITHPVALARLASFGRRIAVVRRTLAVGLLKLLREMGYIRER